IGKEARESMAVFATLRVQLSHRSRRAAACRNTLQIAAGAWRENNDIITVPCAAATVQRITQDLCCASVPRYFLQLATSEERNEAAVGRPKRCLGAFGARQGLRRLRIQRAKPDLPGTLADGSDEYDVRAVGRNRQIGGLGIDVHRTVRQYRQAN